ncbi:DUF4241 domain-containing protein [Dinghuibacter silviterrae]|uniref:Uncharacterized protein DUF4241 n=1 Tax=Dinghuibacter silviterrae TaxID=1539049 RepID=A0A4R8DHA5_9BACT|nr:DUF4241 domain-containing protein [Dinghuibacter silviterrae]TDW96887.1 uncharacterized protein DUF4241 [Dinghuibacter silviterrae]
MRTLLLLGWIGLAGCESRNGEYPISKEKLDTVRHNVYPVSVRPLIFETAFFEGTTLTQHSTRLRFCPIHIGDLQVTTGKVIADCPVTVKDGVPFLADFPVGAFPVQLAIATIKTDERVAFSRILFSPAPVARWEMALLRGQKPLPLYDTSYYGYGVDGGIGLFIDSAANAVMQADDKLDSAMTDSMFIYSMKVHTRDTWDYGVYRFKGQNVAVFSTGWGDGFYGSYIGYDAEGKICRLLTDFGVVDWQGEK